jgi:uncharacterized glyoxalase superfamily protein PhnB
MATSTTETVLQAKGVMPSLTVNDLQQSINFYESLGFAVDQRWERDGKLQGVMLKAGELRLGLGQDDWKKGRDRKKGEGLRLYINAANVDDVAARAKAAGLTLESEPTDTEWGGRTFEVTDPSGFKLTIGKMPQ